MTAPPAAQREATALISAAQIELIPLKSAGDHLGPVRAGQTLTVTTSPKLGTGRTLDLSTRLAASGYHVIPHLAARQITSTAELGDVLDAYGQGGIRDIYVIGGDAAHPAGPFDSALQLLAAIEEADHDLDSVGVACYPEGHPAIPHRVLRQALHDKQAYADYMVSQLCFDADVLLRWLRDLRADAITLPLRVGISGPLALHRLAGLSARIGVGTSIGYLTKQRGLVNRLLRGSTYRPEEFVRRLLAAPDFIELGIERIHIFSFNQVDIVTAWQEQVCATGDE
jgi:methylenetetrahydrofolate reductase (NADPH)